MIVFTAHLHGVIICGSISYVFSVEQYQTTKVILVPFYRFKIYSSNLVIYICIQIFKDIYICTLAIPGLKTIALVTWASLIIGNFLYILCLYNAFELFNEIPLVSLQICLYFYPTELL